MYIYIHVVLSGPTDPVTLNPKLICPVFDVLCPYLPEKVRKTLRCGVRYEEVRRTYKDRRLLTAVRIKL